MDAILETFLTPKPLDTLALIGLMIAFSFIASKVFQFMGIPKVVGFIVAGVLLGTSFLNIVPLELTNELTFISEITLGLIGFDMGSHLRYRQLRRMRRSILYTLGTENTFGA